MSANLTWYPPICFRFTLVDKVWSHKPVPRSDSSAIIVGNVPFQCPVLWELVACQSDNNQNRSELQDPKLTVTYVVRSSSLYESNAETPQRSRTKRPARIIFATSHFTQEIPIDKGLPWNSRRECEVEKTKVDQMVCRTWFTRLAEYGYEAYVDTTRL